MKILAALLLIITAGCSTAPFRIADHAGVYTSAGVNSHRLIILIKLNTDGSIVGNSYGTVESYEAAKLSYVPDTGIYAGSIRGQLVCADGDPSKLSMTLTFSGHGETEPDLIDFPNVAGSAHFDESGNLVDTAANPSATPSEWSGTWTKQ